jgi:hypothetical protein
MVSMHSGVGGTDQGYFCEDPIVRTSTHELWEVALDLCTCASILLLIGPRPCAEVLIEQATDLLIHRAFLARSRARVFRRGPDGNPGLLFSGYPGVPWMN